MKALARGISALMLIVGVTATAIADMPKKILMVVSGYGQDAGKTKPGYEFDEFASAYLVFKNNGLVVDVASPKGGAVEADRFDPESPKNAIVLADADAMAKIENTLPLASVDASDYASVFVVGGKGAMFDLPNDQKLQNVIAGVYEQGGVVSAVCHGPAALTNVQLKDGSYLVDGKKVNGFTNVEEQLFGQKWMPQFDFMLEDKLKERGGKFQSSPMMLSHVAEDGRLITGQNPMSTPEVAEAVVRSLGIEPAPREMVGDESTFALIAEIVAGKQSAVAEFETNKAAYNGVMVASYGYFYAQAAKSDAETRMALKLMKMVPEMLARKQLHLQVAKSHLQLKETVKAKAALVEIVEKHPDFEPAQKLLKTL